MSRTNSKWKLWIKRLLVFLLLFTSLLVIIYGFRIGIIKPSSSLDESAQKRLLLQRDDLKSTLVVLEEDDNTKILGAWYVVYNERNSSTIVYYIPPSLYMRDYLGKVSQFVSIGELKYLGDSINPNRKIEYAVWQLGNLTGITIDSYIWLKRESIDVIESKIGSIKQYDEKKYIEKYKNSGEISANSYLLSYLFDVYPHFRIAVSFPEFSKFITNIDTNFTQMQLLQRWIHLENVFSSGNIYLMDLTQVWATNRGTNVSGKEINVINYNEVDKRLEEVIKDLKGREIEKEQVKVEVYNASEIEGLAGRYTRKFENAGLDVIRYENAPSVFEKTTIYVSNPTGYQKSLDLAKKLLFVDTNIVNSRPEFMTTGDIVVILGKDLALEAVWK